MRVTRAITNHAPISQYRLRFFSKEEFKCLCGLYLIESQRHILHDCRRWLEVMRDIGRYVEGCDLCQRIKNRIEEVVGKLKLSEVPEKP